MSKITIGVQGELACEQGSLLAQAVEIRDEKFLSYVDDPDKAKYPDGSNELDAGPTQSYINAYLFNRMETSSSYLFDELLGKKNGIATLDESGQVPSSQLPSYVDDVLDGKISDDKLSFTLSDGTVVSQSNNNVETGKIYVDTSSNESYRWSGSQFTLIASSLVLGTTHTNAAYGDEGAEAYRHAQAKGIPSSGFNKITSNSDGHITYVSSVEKSDLVDLIGTAKSGEVGLVSIPTNSGVNVDDNGNVTLNTSYIINTVTSSDTSYATATLAGVIKVGSGLSINSTTGILSVDGDNVTAGNVKWDNITYKPNIYTKEQIDAASYITSTKLDEILISYVKKSDLLTTTIEFTPSSVNCFYGEATSVNVNIKAFGCYLWATKTPVANLTISNITIDDETIGSATSPYSKTLSIASSETTKTLSKTVKYTVNDENYSKNITINPYNRIYYGSSSLTSMTSTEMLKLSTLSSAKSSASGNYSISTVNGQYIWICIPKSMNDIKTVKDNSTGMDVAMSPIIVTLSASDISKSEDYKCFRCNATQGVTKTLNITVS